MSRDDLKYYRMRAATERLMAAAAFHPNASLAHLELAQHYEALIRMAGVNFSEAVVQSPTVGRPQTILAFGSGTLIVCGPDVTDEPR